MHLSFANLRALNNKSMMSKVGTGLSTFSTVKHNTVIQTYLRIQEIFLEHFRTI